MGQLLVMCVTLPLADLWSCREKDANVTAAASSSNGTAVRIVQTERLKWLCPNQTGGSLSLTPKCNWHESSSD